MNYTVPQTMPSREAFVRMFLEAIFPDLDALGCNSTGFGYSSACQKATQELKLRTEDGHVQTYVSEDSNIFRLMFEMAEMSRAVFNRSPHLLEDQAYVTYALSLSTYCDSNGGSIKNWLKKNNPSAGIGNAFEAALFFSYLLLSRDACKNQRKPFFEKCLALVGVTDIDEAVAHKLFHFDWNELGGQGIIEKKELVADEDNDKTQKGKQKFRKVEQKFMRLANRAIILFGKVTLTIFELIGSYSVERDQAKLEQLYQEFSRLFEENIQAEKAMKSAEQGIFDYNKLFFPRSIPTTKSRKPQDFFVIPQFELAGEPCKKTPLSVIKTASQSVRLLMVAKTGLGKSAFLQMASLCMLSDRYATEQERASLQKIKDQLDVPEDMFIISVPARMFSFCYTDARYKDWTKDFVTLFFHCIWKLSANINFYSAQNVDQRFMAGAIPQTEEYKITTEVIDYMQELARTGKLLLILDSFDEISSGEMRAAYLDTLRNFCKQYCSYPEANEVGAHIIVSSREMSPDTMLSLKQALKIATDSAKYSIHSLEHEQRQDLINNWSRSLGKSPEESHEILSQIEKNHYYLDYSVNPYMLSVVCFYFGDDLGSITQRVIATLEDKMQRNNHSADLLIQNVLANIDSILQKIAIETVSNGNLHFSRHTLDGYLKSAIGKTAFEDDEIEEYIERLHEIFVTEVGLIVPADGADDDYQFINNQIRFELAAKNNKSMLGKLGIEKSYRDKIPSIANTEEYVGLLVPLICNINLENVQLAESLIFDLAMYDFHEKNDESILIRAMLDLLFNRYGSNITTAEHPGDKDAEYVHRAQRILLMRIFTAKNLTISEEEKEELLSSPVFKSNQKWFSENPFR